ncbi:MAG: YraN family protein [Candidatus Omnitrophota bacterium]
MNKPAQNPSRRQKGDSAEDIAVDFLRRQRYRILERNYRVPCGEIDIIARQGGHLCFIEVKFRRGGLEDALEAVSPAKQRTIRRVASFYLQEQGKDDAFCRFDVVALIADHERDNVRPHLIKDAF